jgi:hypothetical protein
MKAWVYAHTPEEYARWAAENLKTASAGPGTVTAAATTEEKGKP